VCRWVHELYDDKPSRVLWTSLDDRLRLALAQGWVLGMVGAPDDDLAEDLAADDSDNRHFAAMFDAFVDHWRSVYSTLRHGVGVSNQVDLVGADMELVVLTAPEHIGRYPKGAQIPAHAFVTRLEADDWLIAATARRLPVPGWPPTEEAIPGLSIDP
jgi:hypothetical protein